MYFFALKKHSNFHTFKFSKWIAENFHDVFPSLYHAKLMNFDSIYEWGNTGLKFHSLHLIVLSVSSFIKHGSKHTVKEILL